MARSTLRRHDENIPLEIDARPLLFMSIGSTLRASYSLRMTSPHHHESRAPSFRLFPGDRVGYHETTPSLGTSGLLQRKRYCTLMYINRLSS
jgi:hypothetical protein